MKKFIFPILLLMLFATAFAGSLIGVNAYKKDNIVNADSTVKLNPVYIKYVEPNGTGANIFYVGLNDPNFLTKYSTRDNIDSIYKRSNIYRATLVKLLKVYLVPGTTRDTNSYVLVNINFLKEGKAATIIGQTKVRSQWRLDLGASSPKYNFHESRDSVYNRIDSIEGILKPILSVRGDTLFQRINGVATAITPIDTP